MVATVAASIDERLMKRVAKRLQKLPADFAPVIDRSLTAVEGELRKEGPRDTGTGQRGFRKERATGRAFSLEGAVVNNMIHMAVLDVGRRPGAKPPPPAALAGWARRHGFTGSLFVLSRAIGRKGWRSRRGRKHRGYVKRALKASVNDINGIIAAWARGVRW